MTAKTTHIEGPTPGGGAYAVAVTDDEGNVEITEYDKRGSPISRTYGHVATASRGVCCPGPRE